MEVSRYYTPSLEEFHVGFEFESIGIGGEYFCRVYGDNMDVPLIESDENLISSIEEDIRDGEVRVKYLDREDIGSLGFKYCKESNLATIYSYKDYFIAYYNSGHISITEMGEMCRRDTILFNGWIKNKSELKRVLKMIGVVE